MVNIVSILKESIDDIKDHVFLFITCIMLDIIFLFFYGGISGYFASRAINPLEGFGAAIQQGSGINYLSDTAMSEITSAYSSMTFFKAQLIMVAALFILFFFLSWVIMQSVNWYLSSRIAQDKLNLKKALLYVWKFFLVSLFWLVIFIIVGLIFLKLSFPSGLQSTIRPREMMIFYTGVAVYVATLYFTLISYSVISTKSSIRQILHKTFDVGLNNFLLIALIFVIFFFSLYLFSAIQSAIPVIWAKIVLGLLTSLPLLTFFRVTMKNLTESL